MPRRYYRRRMFPPRYARRMARSGCMVGFMFPILIISISSLLLFGCSNGKVNEPFNSHIKELSNKINSSIVKNEPMDDLDLKQINIVISEYEHSTDKTTSDQKAINLFKEYVKNCNTVQGVENVDIEYCKNEKEKLNKMLR